MNLDMELDIGSGFTVSFHKEKQEAPICSSLRMLHTPSQAWSVCNCIR